jgi:hypothetical protein
MVNKPLILEIMRQYAADVTVVCPIQGLLFRLAFERPRWSSDNIY